MPKVTTVGGNRVDVGKSHTFGMEQCSGNDSQVHVFGFWNLCVFEELVGKHESEPTAQTNASSSQLEDRLYASFFEIYLPHDAVRGIILIFRAGRFSTHPTRRVQHDVVPHLKRWRCLESERGNVSGQTLRPKITESGAGNPRRRRAITYPRHSSTTQTMEGEMSIILMYDSGSGGD